MADAPSSNQFDGSKLKVRVVTPERILVDTDAASVSMPGLAGVLEVMPGAAPLMTAIGAGPLLLSGAGAGEQKYIVARGFAEVLPDRVTVLVEYAETPEAVNQAEAEQQLSEGQKQEGEAGDDPTKYEAARLAVIEAEAKLGRVVDR